MANEFQHNVTDQLIHESWAPTKPLVVVVVVVDVDVDVEVDVISRGAEQMDDRKTSRISQVTKCPVVDFFSAKSPLELVALVFRRH